jgi:hypothetical protein
LAHEEATNTTTESKMIFILNYFNCYEISKNCARKWATPNTTFLSLADAFPTASRA